MIKTVIHTTITYMITSLLCVYSNQHVHFFQKYSFTIIVKLTSLTKKPRKDCSMQTISIYYAITY